MVIFASIIRRFTRIGTRNPIVIGGGALLLYILFNKEAQHRVASGVPVLSSASTAFAKGLEDFLPLDIFGRELTSLGEGFSSFSENISSGFTSLISPVTNFIDYALRVVGKAPPEETTEG